MTRALLVVLSGPSGVGKDAVLEEILALRPGLHRAITATTRPPRSGEVHGEHYRFVAEAEFIRMVEANELLEHAVVYDAGTAYRGASVQEPLARGQDVICRVDIQGAVTVRAALPDAVLIFLAPPRWRSWSGDFGSARATRLSRWRRGLAAARVEMAQAAWFDHVVVNETGAVVRTAARVLEVLAAERIRARARSGDLPEALC